MRSLWIIFVLLFLSPNILLAIESEKDVVSSEVEVIKEKQISFVSISEVPKEASTIKIMMDDIIKKLKEDEELNQIHLSLPSYSESITLLIEDTKLLEVEETRIEVLRKKSNELDIYLRDLKKRRELLSKRIEVYDKNLQSFEQHLSKWKKTAVNGKEKLAPEAILEQINTTITNIETLKKDSKKSYDILLTDSNIINNDIVSLSEVINKLNEASTLISSKFFYQHSLSLYSLFQQQSLSPFNYFTSSWNTLKEVMNDFILYYTSNGKKLLIFSLFSLLIMLFVFRLYYLYKKHRLFVYETSYKDRKYFFILRPFSTALILILLLNVFMFTDISETAKYFQRLFLLFPIFRIFQTLIPSSSYRYLYTYFIFYILSVIEDNAFTETLDARLFSIFLTIGLGVFLYKLLRYKIVDDILKPSRVKFVSNFFIFLIIILFVSVIADIYGATLLASYITHTVFVALYALIVFYILTVILAGYTILLLRRRIATATHMVEVFARDIEKSVIVFVKLFMTLWWFIIVLKTVDLYAPLLSFIESILALSWQIGETIISVKSIVYFLFIIFTTWFVSKVIRMILEVEVFARFKFPRGVPTAIHTVLNYIVVIVGTIIALSSLGITKEQFTLVAGALGVGIGFGLRNIIANFVSGLIMVFERPIQIGDTIEINNTMGTVQSIGARSSTVSTFDGSEVIIPNADFISHDIINWTLSDERRRKNLVFKIALDSDIYKVLGIMKDVASNHPNTLDDPEPMATFLGFNEHYLEFKLYFWLHENLIMAQSDITIAIYERLKKEGIKMPIPQQEFLKHEPN